MPTAQSGRSLRLALARRAAELGFGGILPPRLAMASELLASGDSSVATEAEELAVLAETLLDSELTDYPALFPHPPDDQSVEWAIATARSLLSVSSLLGERALLCSEVDAPEDENRWRDLAALERKFFARLTERGLVARALAKRKAIAAGCLEEGITEIVLPAAVDLTDAFIDYLKRSSQKVTILIHAEEAERDKFDEFGRPIAPFAAKLSSSQVEAFPTAVIEADHIARYFRSVPASDALPALAVCDAAMYPELEGAFQNHFEADELVLRNPAVTPLVKSALGRLLVAILRLSETADYETLAAFLRTGDVTRWAAERLSLSAAEVVAVVGELDAVQNAHLPRTIEETLRGAEADGCAQLAALIRAVREELPDPFGFIRKIFASLTIDERLPGDRELIAAAEVVRDIRAAVASGRISPRVRDQLRLELVKSAAYMLEPLGMNVLATTGWLELPWCQERELVLAGFNEGCVPENIVGHPFVPNELRAQLKLLTNERRAIRDSFILAEALRSRDPKAVHVSLHQIAGDKNVMKPSRLLFPLIADSDLPELALRLYAVTKGSEGAPAKKLPEAWRLKLPLPPTGVVPRVKIATTLLDSYRRCPFTFYLNEVFGEPSDDRLKELDNRAFGTLAHQALDAFAKSAVKDSKDASTIFAFLKAEVQRLLAPFGSPLPAVIELQGEALLARLEAFSRYQAKRRAEGWRIIAAERSFSCTIKSSPTRLTAKIDRIDEHESTGELMIIDYKTWNRASEDKFDSIQLPVYRAMIEASGLYDERKAREAKAIYCVLAEREEDAGFLTDHVSHAGTQSADEDRIVELLERLNRGIFYPPVKESKWADVYGSLIWESPAKGISEEWLADQAARIKAYEEARQ